MPHLASPDLELERNTLICHDPQAIAEAGKILLHDDGIDMIVVRGLVAAQDTESLLTVSDDRLGGIVPDVEALYALAPQLKGLDEVVADFWSEQGYADFKLLAPHLSATKVAGGGVGIHTDYMFYEQDLDRISLVGPVSLSIAVTPGRGLYQVQKPQSRVQDNEGNFVYAAWKAAKYRVGPPALRSQEWQYQGDGVLFMNHPRQSYHAVTAAPERRAALYDYNIAHETAFQANSTEDQETDQGLEHDS